MESLIVAGRLWQCSDQRHKPIAPRALAPEQFVLVRLLLIHPMNDGRMCEFLYECSVTADPLGVRDWPILRRQL